MDKAVTLFAMHSGWNVRKTMGTERTIRKHWVPGIYGRFMAENPR